MKERQDPNIPINESIKDALVQLLAKKDVGDITISELTREAHVARGTFYRRYATVGDVYREVVLDVVDSSRSFSEQIACLRCGMESHRPKYCEMGAANRDACAVMRQPSFLNTMLGLDDFRAKRHFSELAKRWGLSEEQAQAVFTFQVSGCHAIAVSELVGSDEWENAREAVDHFIAGGFAALSAKYGNSNGG